MCGQRHRFEYCYADAVCIFAGYGRKAMYTRMKSCGVQSCGSQKMPRKVGIRIGQFVQHRFPGSAFFLLPLIVKHAIHKYMVDQVQDDGFIVPVEMRVDDLQVFQFQQGVIIPFLVVAIVEPMPLAPASWVVQRSAWPARFEARGFLVVRKN